jgi:hypothetical protein
MAFQGGSSSERAARPGSPRRVGGISADRGVWPVIDDIQREAIRAEGLDPNNPAAVAALELVGLELGRTDSNLGRQRAGPTLCTPNRVRSGSDTEGAPGR